MNAAKQKQAGLSPYDFFAIGFGAIVGVGWAVSINGWMASAGGPVPAAIGYVLSLILMIPIALAYAELTPMLPVAGGGVAFAYKAFGGKIAFLSGWAAIGAFITIIPWEAIYITDISSVLIPALKAGDPLYTLASTDIYWQSLVLGTVLSAVIFYINWIGVKSSAIFQKIMCTILIAAGVIAIIFAIGKADFSNLQPLYDNIGHASHSSFWGGALAIFASSPFFLAGFETIPQGIEESRGDIKNVGKTVVTVIAMACIFYAILLFTLGLAMPWEEFYHIGSPAAPNLFAAIYGAPFGNVLFVIILIGVLGGLLTTWNGFMIATPRLMMGLARASLIPHFFAAQNKAGTPKWALVFCAVFSIAGPFLGLGLIDPLTSFSAAGFVLSWLITLCALIALRKKEPDLDRPYKIPSMIIPWFGTILTAIIFVMILIPGTPCYMSNLALLLFVCWMVIGLVLYVVTIPSRNKIPEAERTASLFAHMSEAK